MINLIICNEVAMDAGYDGPWTCDICSMKNKETVTDDNSACSFCDTLFSCCANCATDAQPADRRLCHLPHRDLPADVQQFAVISKEFQLDYICTLQEMFGDGARVPAVLRTAQNLNVDACYVFVFPQPNKFPPARYVMMRSTYTALKPAPGTPPCHIVLQAEYTTLNPAPY